MTNRTVAISTCAAALLTLTACKGGATSAEASKLIPDAAIVMGGVDMRGMMKSSLYTDNRDMLDKGEAKETIDAAKACNLGPETWQSLVFGFDPEGGDAKVAAVFTATGLGKKENLACLADKFKERAGGEAPWTSEEKDGVVVLTFEGEGGRAFVVDDNTVAVAGTDWVGAVEQRVAGKGTAAMDGSLKTVLGRTDMKKTIWAAGTVPAALAEGPASGMTDFAMWIDAADGLELLASVGVKDADTATSKATELQTQFDAVKGLASTVGISAAVIESVKIAAEGAAIRVSAKASAEDVAQLSKGARESLSGVM